METIIGIILVGLLAGWLGSLIMKGKGSGLIVNLVVGIIGAFLGNWLLGKVGIDFGSGFIGNLITAVIGAVVLLFIARLVNR